MKSLVLTACLLCICLFTVPAEAVLPPEPMTIQLFERGDANTDGRVDLSDALTIANQLFLGGKPTSCEAAADINDDGSIDVSDPVALLNAIYLGSGQVAAPAGYCGADTTRDQLSCLASECDAVEATIILGVERVEPIWLICVMAPCPWSEGGWNVEIGKENIFVSDLDLRRVNLSADELAKAKGHYKGFVVEDAEGRNVLVVWGGVRMY
jgi:hypothetical protein